MTNLIIIKNFYSKDTLKDISQAHPKLKELNRAAENRYPESLKRSYN